MTGQLALIVLKGTVKGKRYREQCLNCGKRSGRTLTSERGAVEIESPKALRGRGMGRAVSPTRGSGERCKRGLSGAPAEIEFDVF